MKIKKDIDRIEESCRLVSETLAFIGKRIVPGVTTLELDSIAEDFIRTKGAEPAFKGYGGHGGSPAFPYTLCISIDEEVVHGMPSNRKIKEGQIVSVDCGVKKDGFFGDSAFTFAVGDIGPEKQRLLDVTRQALEYGVEQAVAGRTNYDIAKAVQSHVEKNRFSCVRELVGHGVGAELHMDPCIPNFVPGLLQRNRYPKAQLEQGMTIAIEPMVNMGTFLVQTARDGWTVFTSDGRPSAHFEHTVMVDNGVPRVLTFFED
ncbi:MAG: type I methionyl aminopeptidase [Candidatus Kapaibacterium sp.]